MLLNILRTALMALRSSVRSRAALELENVALRHQICVLQRSAKKRLRLTPADRLFWVVLSRIWIEWRAALAIVQPETVIAWHRKGFRLFWTWKVRRGKPGRPAVPHEVRDLIRRMSREKPLWRAPHIHGELLKLGIAIGQTSVAKYMARFRNGAAGSCCDAIFLQKAVGGERSSDCVLHLDACDVCCLRRRYFH
jgi:hypothetical protein